MFLISGTAPPSPSVPRAERVSEHASADPAQDMSQLGDVVPHGDHIDDFPADVQNGYQDQGERHGAVLRSGDRGQHDQHEDDAACPEKRVSREEDHLNDPGDTCGDEDRDEDLFAAVLLLHRRTDDKEHQHVPDEMLISAVTQHVGEQPQPGQRRKERRPVNGEQDLVAPAARDLAEDQRGEGDPGKRQDDRGIVLKFQTFFHQLLPQLVILPAKAPFPISYHLLM